MLYGDINNATLLRKLKTKYVTVKSKYVFLMVNAEWRVLFIKPWYHLKKSKNTTMESVRENSSLDITISA